MKRHATLIEVTTFDDLNKLNTATSREHASHIIAHIIKRLREPRAYIAEQEVNPLISLGSLWEEGRDMLSSELIQSKISIIDPETLRYLATWSDQTADRVAIWNPFLTELLPRPGLFQQLWTPDDDLFKDLRNEARRCRITVHYWKPIVETVRK